jgi:hypothetical protein
VMTRSLREHQRQNLGNLTGMGIECKSVPNPIAVQQVRSALWNVDLLAVMAVQVTYLYA